MATATATALGAGKYHLHYCGSSYVVRMDFLRSLVASGVKVRIGGILLRKV